MSPRTVALQTRSLRPLRLFGRARQERAIFHLSHPAHAAYSWQRALRKIITPADKFGQYICSDLVIKLANEAAANMMRELVAKGVKPVYSTHKR